MPAGLESALDTIERLTAEWEHRFRLLERLALDAHDEYAATGQKNALAFTAIQMTSTAARVVNLANGVIASINSRNADAAPAVARALLETCAVPAYQHKHLVPALRDGDVERAHKLIFRLGLGASKGMGTDRVKPIRVGKLVEAFRGVLAERFGEADAGGSRLGWSLFYDALSELTHPNMGATTMSLTLAASGPSWRLQPPFGDFELSAILGATTVGMEIGGSLADEVMDAAARHTLPLPAGEPTWASDEIHSVPRARFHGPTSAGGHAP